MEVKVRNEVKIESEKGHEVFLPFDYFLLGYGFVGNLLWDHFWMKRENIFVFGGKIHRCYTEGVNLLVVDNHIILVGRNEILVQDSDC